MKKLMLTALIAVVFMFGSCSTLRKAGHSICEAQQGVTETVTVAAEWFGFPGKVVAAVIGGTLKALCAVTNGSLNFAADAIELPVKAVGLMEDTEK